MELLNQNQTFSTPSEALAHHGVKGQRWGVRKDDDLVGRGSSRPKLEESSIDNLDKVMTAFYATKSTSQLEAEGKAKLAEQVASEFPAKSVSSKRIAKAEKAEGKVAELDEHISAMRKEREALRPGARDFLKKADLDSRIRDSTAARNSQQKRSEQLRSGKLTDAQKTALIGLGSAAAVAGLAYYGSKRVEELNARNHELNQRETSRQWEQLFGRPHPGVSTGALGTLNSGGGSFYVGLTNKKALSRPEFTIPEGTIFQRLSNHPEDTADYGKVKGAYATFLNNDKKLYGASGEFGHKKYTVNFEADGPARVPSLPTVLAHLKQMNKAEYPDKPSMWSDERVYQDYHAMAGGGWSGGTATRLFESLRTYGYSAIVDDMDAGYLGDLPVVFFGKAKPGTSTERTAVDRGNDKAGLLQLSREFA